MRGWTLIAIGLAACGPGVGGGGVKGGGEGTAEQPAGDACVARTEARAAVEEGRLALALSRVVDARKECPGVATVRLQAEILGELGLDERAIAVWQEVAAQGSKQDEAEAQRAIAALGQRPPAVKKDVSDEDRALALRLYREGVDERLAGRMREALAALRRSYVLAPHPLTIVQIGMVHRAAGREIEARKSFERAMAIAEAISGATAVGALQRGHADEVYSVEWSRDGKMVASASGDGTVKLWDAITRRELRTIGGFASFPGSVAIAPDGGLVAVAGDQDGIRTVDLRGSAGTRLLDVKDSGRVVEFSPDGTLLAAGYGSSKAVVLWDVVSGQRVRVLGLERRGTGAMGSIAFSPDGTLIAAGDSDGTVTVYEVASGATRMRLRHGQWVHAVAFAPDGKTLASGGGRVIKIWEVGGGMRPVRELAGHLLTIEGLAYAPDGARLVSGGGTVRIWKLADGSLERELGTIRDKVSDVALRPRDGTIATASSDAAIRLWDLDDGSEIGRLGGMAGKMIAVAFVPGRDLFLTGGEDGQVRQWDLGTDAAPTTLLTNGKRIARLEPAADGRTLLVVDDVYTEGTRLSVWDLLDQRETFTLSSNSGPAGPDLSVATLSPDGKSIAAGDFVNYNRHVALWDVGGTAPRTTFQLHGSSYRSIAFAPDGTLVAVADGVSRIRLLDTRSGASRDLVGHGYGVSSVVFSPDGTQLCSTGLGNNDVSILWDVASGKPVHKLAGHTKSISRAAFSPDGTRLATAAWDQTVRVWNTRTGAARVLEGHGGSVHGVAFSRDSRTLASASDDRTVMLWDVRTGAALATVFVTRDGQWLVIGSDGRVDGSPGADGGASFLSWKIGDYELPGFAGWERAYTPGLLAQIAARP